MKKIVLLLISNLTANFDLKLFDRSNYGKRYNVKNQACKNFQSICIRNINVEL